MDRRNFVKNTGFIGGGIVLTGSQVFAGIANEQYAVPLNQAMRWAQLAFVESDPGNYDPDFWLNYFKRIHAQGVLLSAGGVVAFYPTNIPFHYRSRWMKKYRSFRLFGEWLPQDEYGCHPSYRPACHKTRYI